MGIPASPLLPDRSQKSYEGQHWLDDYISYRLGPDKALHISLRDCKDDEMGLLRSVIVQPLRTLEFWGLYSGLNISPVMRSRGGTEQPLRSAKVKFWSIW